MANSPGTAFNVTEIAPYTEKVKEAFPGKLLAVLRWRDAVEWEVVTEAQQKKLIRVDNDVLRSPDGMTELGIEIYRVKKER